jgi:two-component system sensor histidine kinase DesK
MLMKTMQKAPPGPQHHLFSSPWVLWIVWIIWLPFIVPGVVPLLQGPLLPVSLPILAVMAVFVAIYALCSFRVALALSGRSSAGSSERATTAWRTAVTLILLALSVGTELLGKPRQLDASSLFIFTTAYAGSSFRIPRGIITNAVVLAVCMVTGALLGFALPGLLTTTFVITVVSFMTMSWTRSIVVGRKLHEAQGEIARLAASEERLRIARDLHDLLGQKLSFIALKSELARHLVASAPDRAEAEIAEVESTVRSTLQEVREAVAGYRRPDVAHELRAAQEILSAAGIRLVNRCEMRLVDGLSEEHNTALAWAVREGVTNVIRHSRAKTCTIDLTKNAERIVVEISDDGAGPAETAAGIPSRGNGLRGLRERLEALGGKCDAQSRAPVGFALTAVVPTRGPL